MQQDSNLISLALKNHVHFSIKFVKKTIEVWAMDTESEIVVQPVSFAPNVLSAVAPDISFQRHLALGLRPSLRQFEEFQNIQIQKGDSLCRGPENVESPILGASLVKSGATSVICTITGGVIERSDEEFKDSHTSIYPVVEIARGRVSGPPTDEEMIIAQQIQDLLLQSKIVPTTLLDIDVGYKLDSKVVFAKDNHLLAELTPNKKNYCFVLYANIQVFSRTGPLFDLCYGSVISALRSVKLPVMYVDESVSELVVKTKNRNIVTQSSHRLLCHPSMTTDLKLESENLNWCVTFGVVTNSETNENVLIADIEGEAEETCTASRVSVVVDTEGKVKNLKVINGGDVVIQQGDIYRLIDLAKKRVHDLLSI